MNKILSTPRRLVLALVAAGAIGALGATGAGLVGVVHGDARAATSVSYTHLTLPTILLV